MSPTSPATPRSASSSPERKATSASARASTSSRRASAAAVLAAATLLAALARAASEPPPAETAPIVDRLLRRAADVLTDMSGPVGRVHFPVITTNPNAGTTYGFLPVWLFTDPEHRIRHIAAPMFTYNPTFGPAFSGTYYYYPTARANLRVVLEKAAKSNYRAAARHENLGFLDGRCVLRLDSNYEADGTPRFFGVGPASAPSGEASYRLIEKMALAEVGLRYWGSWQMTAGWKYRRTSVTPGPFQTAAVLDPRLQTQETASGPRLSVLRDTRDFPATPGRGGLAELFVEFHDRDFGDSADYRRYGGQWRYYIPQSARWTAGVHAQAEWARGAGIPFTSLASLGGPRSLRGFPEGRFQDNGSVFINVEERWTIHRLDVVNARTEFQIAPFLDAGTVFHDAGALQVKYAQAVGGVAFRAVVKPTVVGRVELGAGREGPAAFVGIDYPF